MPHRLEAGPFVAMPACSVRSVALVPFVVRPGAMFVASLLLVAMHLLLPKAFEVGS